MASTSNNGNGFFPRYSRAREVARKLGVFNPGEYAGELGVSVEDAEKFIGALLWQGLLLPDVEFESDGNGGEVPVYTMEPLPDTIYKRSRYPPVWLIAVLELGGFELFNVRGVAVRLRTERDMRRTLSTPGARQHHKNREREWLRQQSAKREESRLNQERLIAQSQGRQYEPREKTRKPRKAGRKTK